MTPGTVEWGGAGYRNSSPRGFTPGQTARFCKPPNQAKPQSVAGPPRMLPSVFQVHLQRETAQEYNCH